MKKEIFRSKREFQVVLLLKYILFFLLTFVLWKAGIKNNIFPFATGLFIALCWCNQNVYIMSGIYILTGYLSSFSLVNVICSSVCAVVIIFVMLIHKWCKKPIKIWMLTIYSVISQLIYIYFNYSTHEKLLSVLLSIALATIFMLVCVKIFKALLVRGIGLKLTIDEKICMCVFLSSISLGLTTITLFGISLSKIYAVFMILLCTYLYSDSTAVVVATTLGLGEALYSNNLIITAGYAIMAILSLSFRTSHPYFSIMAVSLTELVLGLYFNIYGTYTFWSFASIILGVALFILVNSKTLPLLKILFAGNSSSQASRNIINRSRDELCKRMFEISNIFYDMNKTFRNMVKGVLPVDEAKRMLAQEVMQKVCGDCPERFKCLRTLADETSKVFDDIISAGFERGKATILDIPPFLSTRCSRVNTILQAINQLIISYKQYANMVSSMDSSRLLIADQLQGVSGLLNVLATETQKNLTFDENKEKQIVEELNYYNILASEVVYYEKDTETVCVTMLIRESDKDSNSILKVLSKICGYKMILVSSVPSQTPSFVVQSYQTAPKYDLVYGSSGSPKFGNTISGDSYSFIKLTNDKVLLAICDGMGSGENAQKTSDTAISLIENFYKAGFDNEIILNSVNKFLSIGSDENYSALDLCVVDLKTSSADFVKVGAPEGLIRHKTETEILNSGALPLGILEEMKPTIIKKMMTNDDMIIICSDGVIDSFGSVELLQQFVGNTDTTNPQTLSNLILEEAITKSNKQLKDDCTVVCARVFDRV